MCFSSPKPPPVARIAPPPAPAPAPTQKQVSAEVEARQSGKKKADIRKFDLKLPSSFQIPR